MADSMIIRMYDNHIDHVDGGIVLTNYKGALSSKSQFYNNTITNYGQGGFIYASGEFPTSWQGDYGGTAIDTSKGIRPYIVITRVDTLGNRITIHSVANTTMPKQFSIDGETWQSDSVFTNVAKGVYMTSARIAPAIRDNHNQVWITNASVVYAPPMAHAGTDQTLNSDVNTTNLAGTATAGDGTIASYTWSKVGTNGATITSPNSQNTSITGLQNGKTYTFRLTVTDSNGLNDTDDVNITVQKEVSEIKLLLYMKNGKLIRIKTQ